MKVLNKYTLVFAFFFSGSAFSHGGIKLESSNPSSNAMLMESPQALSFSFSQELRLMKVTVKGQNAGEVDVGFRLSHDKEAEYTWALPKLKPDTYTVEWIAMGSDGHKMKESYSFMVH